MDEVNLLDDGLVDVVLDSAASGVNTVEREGVSIAHPAKAPPPPAPPPLSLPCPTRAHENLPLALFRAHHPSLVRSCAADQALHRRASLLPIKSP